MPEHRGYTDAEHWRAANRDAKRTDILASGIMSEKVEGHMVASYQK